MNTETLTLNKINGHKLNGFTHDDIGDDHLYTGLETPMKSDAFELSDTEKNNVLPYCFRKLWMSWDWILQMIP